MRRQRARPARSVSTRASAAGVSADDLGGERLAQQFGKAHWFDSYGDVSAGPFAEIDVDQGVAPPGRGKVGVVRMTDQLRNFVFGYGSLLRGYGPEVADRNAVRPTRGRVAHLRGYRRAWNVAMDNRIDLPGYKFYLGPLGERPSVFVTFLNLIPSSHRGVSGVLFPATSQDLHTLDARERNYERADVTAQVVDAPLGTVWTYIGTREAEDRYEAGIAAGSAVISREYYEGVWQDFAGLGETALAEFTATIEPPACPIMDLERIDLPTASRDKMAPSRPERPPLHEPWDGDPA
jgi:cation transport regulator ChaC